MTLTTPRATAVPTLALMLVNVDPIPIIAPKISPLKIDVLTLVRFLSTSFLDTCRIPSRSNATKFLPRSDPALQVWIPDPEVDSDQSDRLLQRSTLCYHSRFHQWPFQRHPHRHRSKRP